MISIVIDSNIFFMDPLWNGSGMKKILDYSKYGLINILISDVVIKEVTRNVEKEFDSKLNSINGAIAHLSKLSNNIDSEFKLELPSNSTSEISSCFKQLAERKLITVVEHDGSIMGELIERAVYKKMPFKEKKEEFRDAVIWLSCVNYAINNDCSHLYLITNNISDFAKNKGTEIHDDLKEDFSNSTLYRSVKEFLDHHGKELNAQLEITPIVKMESWFDSLNMDKSKVTKILEDKFQSLISAEVSLNINDWGPSEFFPDIYTGYVQSNDDGDLIVDESSLSFDISSEYVTVLGTVVSNRNVEVYAYQPVYDSRDDKYAYIGDRDVDIEIDFEFTISPDQEMPTWLDIDSIRLVEI